MLFRCVSQSRYNTGTPDNTDEDYIVLVPRLKTAKFLLQIQGFKTNSREYEADETAFMSFKKVLDGVLVNLIVTDYFEFYNQYVAATEDAKERNLLNKADRIKLFDDYINYRI